MLGILIFFIVITMVIVNNGKTASRSQQREQAEQKKQTQTPPPRSSQIRTQPPEGKQARPIAVKTAAAFSVPQTETSTMDYLDEKARQDKKEHEVERLQEQKRVSEKYGNRPTGGRYLLGDPVPQGMKILCCGYCGAENLVKIAYRGDRDCYFCRTHLRE